MSELIQSVAALYVDPRGPYPKVCSAQQRRRTPVAFAEWLINLAASASCDGERHANVSP